MAAVLSVVTSAGITAALTAGGGGPQINITGFQIGDASQAQGYTPDPSHTTIGGNLVYTGNSSQIVYSIIDADTVLWRIFLDNDVGDFQVGNIGLMTSTNVMFAQAVLPVQDFKFKNNLPTTAGNRLVFDIVLTLTGQVTSINLSILVANEASLPVVPTEIQLPPPGSAPFNAYLVENHTQLGNPTVAVRFNSTWFHSTYRPIAGAGETILTSTPSAFDATATVGKGVYWDTVSGTWKPADPSTPITAAIGVRTSTFEITSMGLYVAAGNPFTTGALYYLNYDGSLTLNATNQRMGVAKSSNTLWIAMDGGAGASAIYAAPVNMLLNKQIKQLVPATATTLYTVPTGKIAYLSSLSLMCGPGVTNPVAVTVKNVSAASGNNYYFASNHMMQTESLDELMRAPRVMFAGDQMTTQASEVNRITLLGSIIEIPDSRMFYNFISLHDDTEMSLTTFTRTTNVFSILVVNRTNNYPVPISIRLIDSAYTQYLAQNICVPLAGSLEICSKERVFTSGQQLKVQTSILGNVSVYLAGRIIGS